MEQTLVLNATYEPLGVVSWQRAMTLLYQGKVEVVANYERFVRGVKAQFQLPSVLRLLRHVRLRRVFSEVPFSRANVYARDEHRCQYCGSEFDPSRLTFDHVVPVARGGLKTWENIVTCCIECNRRKGDRLPEERGMKLVRKPRRPDLPRALALIFANRFAHHTWRDYLYFGRRNQMTYGGSA
jgi:5-methylcytosine-specific restriction endonuclease McrA